MQVNAVDTVRLAGTTTDTLRKRNTLLEQEIAPLRKQISDLGKQLRAMERELNANNYVLAARVSGDQKEPK